MNFDGFLSSNNYKTVQVPADGHCLLHSVIYIIYGNDFTKLKPLLSLIKTELTNNTQFWSDFSGFTGIELTKQMNSYCLNNDFQSDFADILPSILSKLLKTSVEVYNVNRKNIFTSVLIGTEYLPNKIMLKLMFQHYQPIVSNDLNRQFGSIIIVIDNCFYENI